MSKEQLDKLQSFKEEIIKNNIDVEDCLKQIEKFGIAESYGNVVLDDMIKKFEIKYKKVNF